MDVAQKTKYGKQKGIKTILKGKEAGYDAIVVSRNSQFWKLLVQFIIVVATATSEF